MDASTEDARRARPGARADGRRASPSAAPASRATTATSSSCATRCPATACAPRSPSASGPTPRRARVEVLEAGPTASSRSPPTRARRGRCCPTSASSRSRPSRSTTRCGGSASSTASSSSRSCPAVEQWRYRNKLEYSFGTGDDGELVCGFHAPGSWERIEHVEDCLLASERGNEARRAALRVVPRAGPGRLRPPRADRPAAQPRRPRGPAHRRAAGAPRHLRRAGRPRRLRRGGRRRQRPVDAGARTSARPPPAA